MAKRDLTGVTDKKVEAEDDNGVDGYQVGQPEGVGIVLNLRKKEQCP